MLFLNFYLFIRLCWVLVALCGLSLVASSTRYSSLWCFGFSLRWLQSTGSTPMGFSSCGILSSGSVLAAHGLRSCDTRAQLLLGMWDLPGPRIELASPALAGRFLSTASPGKFAITSSNNFFLPLSYSLLRFP